MLTKLRETNSRLEKIKLLKQVSEYEKDVLWYTYNPYLNYGIKNVRIDYDNLGHIQDDMFSILDKLANRHLTGNKAREIVEAFAQEHGDLILAVCAKDLNIGVSAKTINKVYPKFIPSFNVQLATEVPIDKITFPICAQLKMDGVRCIARVEKGKAKLFTRNGKEINFPALKFDLERIFHDTDTVLDGELVYKESNNVEDRTKISGRVNSALNGGVMGSDDVQFAVFDSLTLGEFDDCRCAVEYWKRHQRLKYMRSNIITILKYDVLHTKQALESYLDDVLQEGYEGLILKKVNHLYTYKRSKDWIKLKNIKTADILCVDEQFGKINTKYENDIGKLLCRGVVEGKQVEVAVGSGLTDADRTNHYGFVNKIIEVKYNAVIPSVVKGEHTLFLPRFVAVREDK